ncbi:uncharacterized protein LOC132730579 [Ruditapes philippinarum]|uniref:uncharacterized protein LOC132730579 n=1 Tax=Ruditapes philippinarum TaxID=129788 RepID=UPI00295A9DD6|nr:uncharacterized protein LOC132730579 [Ruditapes philippinarum]
MDDFEYILKHPDFENYVCVNFALVFVCQVLKPYTEHGLAKVHRTIKTALAGNSKCTGTCRDRQTQWCKNCKNWQKHLEAYTSNKKQIDWNKQTTANWDESFENIAGVFSEPKKKIDGPANYLDISTACNVWECCSIFQINKLYIQKVREIRNKKIAHNHTLLISDLDKSKGFDALKDLLNDKYVQPHIQKVDKNALDKIKCIPQSSLRKTIEEIKLKFKKMESCDEENIKLLEQITISTIENSNVLKEISIIIEDMSIQQRLNHMESIHMLSGIKRTFK